MLGPRQELAMPRFWILAVAVSVAASVAAAGAGCTNNRTVDDAHRVIERYFPLDLAETVTTKSAACEAGEVLLGSGYRVDRASLDLTNAVAVQVNRPDGANGWVIRVVRGASSPPAAVSVSLYIYCLHRTDGRPITVSGQTIAGTETPLVNTPRGVATGGGSVRCPAGQTLTSGGFAITLGSADPTNTAAVYNSWIWSSRPSTDRSSWDVRAAFIENGKALPRLRGYARCVRDPDRVMRPVPVSDVPADRSDGFNFDFYAGTAKCGERAFASGGGFAFSGDDLIPHSIAKDQIAPDFVGWTIRGIYGFQTGSSGGISIRPLCFGGLAIEKPDRPDLLVLIGSSPLKDTGCPGGASPCFTFTVVNAGTAAAPGTVAEYASGSDRRRTNTPPLAPGESRELTVSVHNPCTTDCSATVTVDPDHSVAESNETNNTAHWFVVG
jgi:CARDB